MKLLKLPHETAPYRCPVNGLGDIYQWKTGSRIPEAFLLDSRIGCAVLSVPGGKPPVRVFFGEGGIGRSEYEFWSDKLGYRMMSGEDLPFEETVRRIKGLIDREIPVILFGLDMYHLPYHETFYHKIHVPGHVNLMVGYETGTILLHDNDREGVQRISYSDLRQAWAGGYMGFCKRNAYFGIDLGDAGQDIGSILRRGFSETAKTFLHPPADFVGKRGYDTLIRKLEEWSIQTETGTLKEICMHLVTFTASTIPEPPKKLLPYDSGIHNPHRACRDSFSAALKRYADDFGGKSWVSCAEYFERSGELMEAATDRITDILLSGDFAALRDCIPIFREICSVECRAFQQLIS